MINLQSHMREAQQERQGTLIIAALVNKLASKRWLSEMSSALEAANDPDRYLDSFLARTAGAIVVPSLVAQIAQVSDPLVLEARTPLDRIRSRIPVLSQGLTLAATCSGARSNNRVLLGLNCSPRCSLASIRLTQWLPH